MTTARALVLIGAGALLAFAVGFFVYHYVAVTSQFMRLIALV